MTDIQTAPCMVCDNPTRSHRVFPGANLCHKCYEKLDESVVNRMKEKAAKIASIWVEVALKRLMMERDLALGKTARIQELKKEVIH